MVLNALLFGKASLVLVLNEGSFMNLSSIDIYFGNFWIYVYLLFYVVSNCFSAPHSCPPKLDIQFLGVAILFVFFQFTFHQRKVIATYKNKRLFSYEQSMYL